MKIHAQHLSFLLLVSLAAGAQKFDFTSGLSGSGYTRVAPSAVYSEAVGYGFEPGAMVWAGDRGRTLTSEAPFFFSAHLAEGNYNVKVTLGDPLVETTTTVEAESGRLMIERLTVPAGVVVERSFVVNVRSPHLPKLPLNATGRDEVSLDQFDRGNARDWDDKLTLTFISPRAALRTIEITPAPDVPTIFLAGDSTVTDRDSGNDVSWGQLLPRFLKPGIAVANHAQSGETLKSFANSLRLDKILSQMKKGDYLLIQFAHNDSKASWPQTFADADTTYKAYLRVYIAEARLRGATPVLVTAMDRGARGTGAPMHGHGRYPDAVREVAHELNVPVVDLYNMSQDFYVAAGADAAKILADGTHSTAYGGYEFAKYVAGTLRKDVPSLSAFIADDLGKFDPSHPDSSASLHLEGLFAPGEARRPGPARPGPGPL